MAKAKKPVKKFWQKKKAEPKVETPVSLIENQCKTEGCTNPIAPGQTHVCVAHQKSH